jgi:hypothetical protein
MNQVFSIDLNDFKVKGAKQLVKDKAEALLATVEEGEMYYTEIAGLAKVLEEVAKALRPKINDNVLNEIANDFTKLTWAEISVMNMSDYEYNTPAILKLESEVDMLSERLKELKKKAQATKVIVEETDQNTGEIFELFPAVKIPKGSTYKVNLK